MTVARWNLIVFSTVFSSAAIFLLVFPPPPTSLAPPGRQRFYRARAGSAASRFPGGPRGLARWPVQSNRQGPVTNRFGQKLNRSGLNRPNRCRMSPWPVTKMSGIATPSFASFSCNSSQLLPGMHTSSTIQLVVSGFLLFRNSIAFAKSVATCGPWCESAGPECRNDGHRR